MQDIFLSDSLFICFLDGRAPEGRDIFALVINTYIWLLVLQSGEEGVCLIHFYFSSLDRLWLLLFLIS